jgi:DNA-binding Lrp family transcriptional regulator
VNPEARHHLDLLQALEQDGRVTQRGLAAKLGIALGLTNIYLKRLARKGYIKCINVRPNRVRYLITPTGIAEKTRLTYEFMEYSLRLFRESRSHLRAVLQPCTAGSAARIAIFGTGDAAELAYLCLKELGVDPVAIFGVDGGGALFDRRVRSIADHDGVPFDRLIVATLGDPTNEIGLLTGRGVARERLLLLREPAAKSRRR